MGEEEGAFDSRRMSVLAAVEGERGKETLGEFLPEGNGWYGSAVWLHGKCCTPGKFQKYIERGG